MSWLFVNARKDWVVNMHNTYRPAECTWAINKCPSENLSCFSRQWFNIVLAVSISPEKQDMHDLQETEGTNFQVEQRHPQ